MDVGDKSNRVNLYISSELNVDHHTYDSGENRKCISIRCIALDEFFGPEIEINFIKLDIQGFDLYAVQGAKNIINKQESMVIMGELWPYGLSKAGTTPKDYVGLLTQMGFQLKFYNDPESAGYFDGKVGEKEYYTGFIGIKKPNR
jgi:hypothetical protein